MENAVSIFLVGMRSPLTNNQPKDNKTHTKDTEVKANSTNNHQPTEQIKVSAVVLKDMAAAVNLHMVVINIRPLKEITFLEVDKNSSIHKTNLTNIRPQEMGMVNNK